MAVPPRNQRAILRQRAAARSRAKHYREQKRMVVGVGTGCDHLWDARHACMRCGEQIRHNPLPEVS